MWIAASRTRNYCSDDPLLDWLDRYGDAHGFVRDDRGPGFDPRTDFREFIFRKGLEFERAVMAHLAQRFQMVTVCQERGAVRERRSVEATFAAMAGAVEIIAQPALWNAETSTYGMPDLLVRSDVLQRLFPECLSEADAAQPATDLSIGDRHYRVVDIKFTTLELTQDGRARPGHLTYADSGMDLQRSARAAAGSHARRGLPAGSSLESLIGPPRHVRVGTACASRPVERRANGRAGGVRLASARPRGGCVVAGPAGAIGPGAAAEHARAR